MHTRWTCYLVSLIVVESGDGVGDGDVVVQSGARSGSMPGVGVGGEGGSAAFQQKERQKTSKV